MAARWRRVQPGRTPRVRVPSSVMVLDLDGSQLRVVQGGGGGEISRLASETLEFPADADRNDETVLGVAVGKALTRLKIPPGPVVMGVPRAKAVLRTLTVPLIEKVTELASVVHFQVGRDLPFPMEAAVVDFKVGQRIEVPVQVPDGLALGPPGRGEVEPVATPRLGVLVAAVKREVIEHYRTVARAAGCELIGLGLLPDANARCVTACEVADGDAKLILVSLRPDEVSVDIINRQTLVFSRGATIRLGAEAGTGAAAGEAFIRQVVIEVIRSLHGHSGLDVDQPVARILVTGATGLEAGVVTALGERAGAPASLLDPSKALRLPLSESNQAAGAIGAIGLALGAGDREGLSIDFLNPKRPAVQRDLRRMWMLGSVAAAILAVVGVLVLRSSLIRRRTEVLNAANLELADAEKKRPMYRRLVQQAALIEDWIQGGRDWLQHYAYLTSILPPCEEIYLTSLTITSQGAIRMAVQARSGETLAWLDTQLRDAGYEVKPLAITPGADRFGYEFRSTVELVPTAKQKIDLQKVKPPQRPVDDVSLDPVAYRRGGGG